MQVSAAFLKATQTPPNAPLEIHTDAPHPPKAIAAAAHINVLLGSACVTYLVSRALHRVVYPNADRPTEATRVVCLASEVSVALIRGYVLRGGCG